MFYVNLTNMHRCIVPGMGLWKGEGGIKGM